MTTVIDVSLSRLVFFFFCFSQFFLLF
uniref:Uncharacterized protein n=1 Tax=Rhizophora mucronata TaxID=61149 RepID=A0A2P2J392_RHIMU